MSMRLLIYTGLSMLAVAGPVWADTTRDNVAGIPASKLAFESLQNRTGKKPPPPANPLGLAYVPMPKPNPRRISSVASAAPVVKTPSDPVVTDRNGRVFIPTRKLPRERNAAIARELRPTLNSKWTQAQVKTATQRCKLVLATTNLDAEILEPIGGPGGCGIAAPVLVRAFGNMKVTPPAKLNCNLALAIYNWTVDVIQPMARRKFGQSIVAVHNMSSYSCRSRRGVSGGRISEHSFGNALDIGGFTLSSGKKISVLKDWSSLGTLFSIDRKASFLTEVHNKACRDFATVLGPAYNKAHKNHFHIDLGRSGRYKICH